MSETPKEYLSRIGKEGGRKTLAKYGSKHFSELAKKSHLLRNKKVIHKSLASGLQK